MEKELKPRDNIYVTIKSYREMGSFHTVGQLREWINDPLILDEHTLVSDCGDEYCEISVSTYRSETEEEFRQRIEDMNTRLLRQEETDKAKYLELKAKYESK